MDRKQERIIIVLTLYAMDVGGNPADETLNFILDNFGEDKPTGYISESIEGVINSRADIDDIIAQNLKNYKIDRLSYLDLAIIRFATYELTLNKIPHQIVINEALEITKIYSDLGDKKATAFNNQLLDNIKTSLHKNRGADDE